MVGWLVTFRCLNPSVGFGAPARAGNPTEPRGYCVPLPVQSCKDQRKPPAKGCGLILYATKYS